MTHINTILKEMYNYQIIIGSY